ITVKPVGWKTSEFGKCLYARGDRGVLKTKMASHQGNVAPRCEMRKQATILDDVPDPSPDGLGSDRGNGCTIEGDLPGVWQNERDQQPQERSLSTAAGTNEHGGTSRNQFKRQGTKSCSLCVDLGNVVQCKH